MKSSDLEAALIDGLVADLAASGGRARVVTPGMGVAGAADATLELDVDGVTHRLHVEAKRRWTSTLDAQLERMAADDRAAPWILLLPRLDTTRRAWLRDHGINHADGTGAIYLRLPGMRIQVDGGASRSWRSVSPSARTVNPFSKKASLVLRRFFELPDDVHSVTALARGTGIAIGWAWEVCDELLQRGYIAGSGEHLRLADAASVLVHWCHVYTWKKSKRRNFVVPYTKAELDARLAAVWAPSSLPWALTLLSGADRRVGHVAHAAATFLYALPSVPAELVGPLTNVHAREIPEPAPGTHTLCVLEPYYGRAALAGMSIREGLPVVSDLQLFLDLAHYPVRGAETALHLLRTRLAPAVAMSHADIARVERSLA